MRQCSEKSPFGEASKLRPRSRATNRSIPPLSLSDVADSGFGLCVPYKSGFGHGFRQRASVSRKAAAGVGGRVAGCAHPPKHKGNH